MISVTKIWTFDSAHRLPNYRGKCANLHGHTYKLEVTVVGPMQANGMVLDFSLLSRFVKDEIVEKLDHAYLNDIFENPTAEMMVCWIRDVLKSNWSIEALPGTLSRVRLWETPTSYATWEAYNVSS